MQNDQQQKTVTSNSSFVYSHVWVHQYTNKSKQHIWWNTERKTAKLHKQLVWLTKQCNGIVQTLLYTTCNATEENVYIDGMFANEIESINNSHPERRALIQQLVHLQEPSIHFYQCTITRCNCATALTAESRGVATFSALGGTSNDMGLLW